MWKLYIFYYALSSNQTLFFVHRDCPFETSTATLLSEHRTQCRPSKYSKVQCSECGVLISYRAMSRHMSAFHSTDLQCQKCDFATTKVQDFNNHTLYQHSEICDSCGLPIRARERVDKKHECPAESGSPDKKPDPSLIESAKFTNYALLKDDTYVCLVCYFQCSLHMTMRRHMALMHKNQPCPLSPHCEASFKNRLELREHMRSVHTDLCPNCGVPVAPHHDCEKVMFFGDSPLIARIPANCRPVGCHLCKSLMAENSSLAYHMSNKHGLTTHENVPQPQEEPKEQ